MTNDEYNLITAKTKLSSACELLKFVPSGLFKDEAKLGKAVLALRQLENELIQKAENNLRG